MAHWCESAEWGWYCWVLRKLGQPIPPQPPIIPSDLTEDDLRIIFEPLRAARVADELIQPAALLRASKQLQARGAHRAALKLADVVPLLLERTDGESHLAGAAAAALLREMFSVESVSLAATGQRSAARRAAALARAIDPGK